MHTKTYGKFGEYLINVDKLLELTKDIHPKTKEIMSLDLSTIGLTRHSGFSEQRLTKCDIDIPILVDYNNGIIDGRHRILKSIILNKVFIRTISVPKKLLQECLIEKA